MPLYQRVAFISREMSSLMRLCSHLLLFTQMSVLAIISISYSYPPLIPKIMILLTQMISILCLFCLCLILVCSYSRCPTARCMPLSLVLHRLRILCRPLPATAWCLVCRLSPLFLVISWPQLPHSPLAASMQFPVH
jgi:hypothetical protein